MNTKRKTTETLRELKAKCVALEEENLRLHRKIAKLEAEVVSARNGLIAQLENTPPDKLTDEELTYIIRRSQKKRGSSFRKNTNKALQATATAPSS